MLAAFPLVGAARAASTNDFLVVRVYFSQSSATFSDICLKMRKTGRSGDDTGSEHNGRDGCLAAGALGRREETRPFR